MSERDDFLARFFLRNNKGGNNPKPYYLDKIDHIQVNEDATILELGGDIKGKLGEMGLGSREVAGVSLILSNISVLVLDAGTSGAETHSLTVKELKSFSEEELRTICGERGIAVLKKLFDF